MTNILHHYVHEYDFPYHDYLLTQKPFILDNYLRIKSLKPDITDFNLGNSPLTEYIIPKIDNIIHKHYWVGEKLLDLGLRAYIQNNKSNSSFFHRHTNGPGSLMAVFYINPPKIGGELVFTDTNEEKIVQPQKNKLYVFPNWYLHTPKPQQDEDYRICLNWAYGGNVRPIHKVTGVLF